MDSETELKKVIARQGQVISTLALRITVLEQLLLGKQILTEDEARAKATELGEAFAKETEAALKKAAEQANKKADDN